MTEREPRGGAEPSGEPPHPPWPTTPATTTALPPEAAVVLVVTASSAETEACGAAAAAGVGKVVVERRPAEGNGEAAEAAAVVASQEGVRVVIEVGRSSGGADDDGDWEAEKVCRICHLCPDREEDGSELIQLGCGCKGELGIAHRHCAEAWFKLKGNRYCEICGTVAKNITGEEDSRFMEEWHDRRVLGNIDSSDRGGCWRRQPFCNFLMACLVIAFILPWFFRVNMF